MTTVAAIGNCLALIGCATVGMINAGGIAELWKHIEKLEGKDDAP